MEFHIDYDFLSYMICLIYVIYIYDYMIRKAEQTAMETSTLCFIKVKHTKPLSFCPFIGGAHLSMPTTVLQSWHVNLVVAFLESCGKAPFYKGVIKLGPIFWGIKQAANLW